MHDRSTVVDLFCGAGGLSHGFMQAGYEVLFGSDIDPTFGRTFMASHPHAKFAAKPIESLTLDEIFHVTQLKAGELDVLVGGPPARAIACITMPGVNRTPAPACFGSIFGWCVDFSRNGS